MTVLTRELTIRDASHVRRINAAACMTPIDVWAHGDTLMLDAKSLLGLYALVGQRVHIVVEDSVSPRTFDRLMHKMA